ncbi:Tn3 family transposase [Streptomyces sp. NPDC059922]|uniref:Tn3 family transposase n=1 Tax=Streptomyces sp. NPDC059922 TaxID=3347005 RepID=UPI00365B93FD
MREGAISSSTLLKRLRSGSRKNATYTAFREAGRVIRTVRLPRYLTDAPLRRRVTAATNKVESVNRFFQWVGFGSRGVIADNDPVEAGEVDAHQPVRRVQHARARPPAGGVRPEAGRGLHPAARAGPGRGRLRPGRLKGRGRSAACHEPAGHLDHHPRPPLADRRLDALGPAVQQALLGEGAGQVARRPAASVPGLRSFARGRRLTGPLLRCARAGVRRVRGCRAGRRGRGGRRPGGGGRRSEGR